MEGNVFLLTFFAIFTLYLHNIYANEDQTHENRIFIKRHRTAKLICPVMAPESITRWKGPPDLTIYSEGSAVKATLPHSDRIKITGDYSVGEYNLEISNFSSDDEGLYRCISTVRGQLKHTRFAVKLYENPRDFEVVNLTDDGQIIVYEGRPTELVCKFKRHIPEGVLTWVTGNETLSSGGQEVSKYQFTPKLSDNNKVITCTAYREELASLNISAELRVKATPKITIEGDKSITLRDGETLEINCTLKSYALNNESSGIIWYLNEYNNTLDNFSSTSIVKKKNETFYHSQLVIRNLTDLYVGNLYCEVENVNDVVFVKIMYKPKLLTQNKTFDTEKEIPADISLEIKSFENVKVSWHKTKGGKLGECKIWKIGNETGNSRDIYCLSTTIIPLQHSHFGNYTLEIQNSIGKIYVEIQIVYRHWNIRMFPEKLTRNLSDTVILTCQVNPKDCKEWEVTIEHTWNNHLIKQFKPSGNSNTSILTLSFINFLDTGKYFCKLKTPETVFTTYTELLVQGPPIITNISVASLQLGIKIDVYLTSFPAITEIEWYLRENGYEIPITIDGLNVTQISKSCKVYISSYGVIVPVLGRKISFKFGNFIIKHCITFVCRIRNSYGSDERKIDYIQRTNNRTIHRELESGVNLYYIISSAVATVMVCFIVVSVGFLIKRHKRHHQSTNILDGRADEDRHQIELNTDPLLSIRNQNTADYEEVDENVINDAPSSSISLRSSYTSIPNYFQLIGQYEDLCKAAALSDNYLKLFTHPTLKEKDQLRTKHFSTGNIQNKEKTKWKRNSI